MFIIITNLISKIYTNGLLYFYDVLALSKNLRQYSIWHFLVVAPFYDTLTKHVGIAAFHDLKTKLKVIRWKPPFVLRGSIRGGKLCIVHRVCPFYLHIFIEQIKVLDLHSLICLSYLVLFFTCVNININFLQFLD